jgi:hypothetical protein
MADRRHKRRNYFHKTILGKKVTNKKGVEELLWYGLGTVTFYISNIFTYMSILLTKECGGMDGRFPCLPGEKGVKWYGSSEDVEGVLVVQKR